MEQKNFFTGFFFIFIILFAVASVLTYLDVFSDFEYIDYVIYFFYLGAPTICVICLFITFRFYGFKSFEGKVWLFFTIGIFLWLVGEWIFFYYDVFTGEAPFPSIADYVYVAGYVPLILAFLQKARYAKIELEFKRTSIIIIILLSIFLFTTIFIAMPILQDPDVPTVDKVAGLLYPYLDLILLTLALFIAVYWGFSVAKGWFFISAGMILITTADITYAYLFSKNIYTGPVDLLFTFCYLSFALGAIYQKKLHEALIMI
jgi:hypothetical protein